MKIRYQVTIIFKNKPEENQRTLVFYSYETLIRQVNIYLLELNVESLSINKIEY